MLCVSSLFNLQGTNPVRSRVSDFVILPLSEPLVKPFFQLFQISLSKSLELSSSRVARELLHFTTLLRACQAVFSKFHAVRARKLPFMPESFIFLKKVV